MSVQFGRWNFEGQPPAPDYIEKVCATLAPYGPDSIESYSKGGVRILYRAFHTTKESRQEKQPHISPSGSIITWDGRLDNRADLISELGPFPSTARDPLSSPPTDVAIVAAASEKWGANCLGKLIGDWALSIWNPRTRSVLLAKDPIGTKHLFYSFDQKQLTWSSILDPLVLFAGKTFEICEEYIAGWFATYFPAPHLTPYTGIHSISPSSSVLLQPGKRIVSKYWDFDPGKRIRYRSDADYEEHFRSSLGTAVQRRLRSDGPVLAELSGGMDSSSIVCMADTLIACSTAEHPCLDTISWFDDSYDQLEPDTNELHWITKVEEKRGKTGFHINLVEQRQGELDSQRPLGSEFDYDRFAAVPNPSSREAGLFRQYSAYIRMRGHRVVLSGLGGESTTGGDIPTPTPEIQNLLARPQFFALARQLRAWAAKMGKPPFALLWEAIRGFLPLAFVGVPKEIHVAPWFHPGFVRRNRAALRAYPFRIRLFGPLPSFQDNIAKLNRDRWQMAFFPLRSEILRDLRYPYLDRDLLEFMCAIPREQIVRVGQRRSLMKRALVGIVPDELLERKRKAFVPPESPNDCFTESGGMLELGQDITSSCIGIVDRDRLLEACRGARRKGEDPIRNLKRTLTLESWLSNLASYRVLTNPTSKSTDYHSRYSERSKESPRASLETRKPSVPAQPKSSAR